ncbi:hypothetical protein [Nocardia sp. NPDC005366]|uniref:hypothetical protein n=1 Tax=Nocardia sp. NPDC005366 TaxID=3156878 RepID=UPI0033A87AEF
MKRSLAAVPAGALIPAAAQAPPEPAAPVGCFDSSSLHAPPFLELVNGLITGSSSLSGDIA